MRVSQLALADTALMGFKNLQAAGLGGMQLQSGTNPGKLMPEVAIALCAAILGNAQVRHHQLIALTRMLERTLVGDLDAPTWLPAQCPQAGRLGSDGRGQQALAAQGCRRIARPFRLRRQTMPASVPSQLIGWPIAAGNASVKHRAYVGLL